MNKKNGTKIKEWYFDEYTTDELGIGIKEGVNMKQTKYYIHLFDYENGTAIFESDFFETEEEALAFAKHCNFKVSQYVNVELMNVSFDEMDCIHTYFNRNLEPFEYGKINGE